MEPETLRVTVGICAFNEENNIGKLLDNITTQQELPAGSEILVVCSGCTDNTAKIVSQHSKKDSRVTLYIEEKRLGKASAMNQILANGKGDAFLFVSADTMPWKSCFKGLVSKLQASNVGLVCGKPIPENTASSLTDKLVNVLWSFHNHVFKELSELGLARHATEIFLVRKGIVDEIPKETINDDAHIALIAKKKGWLVKYNPESVISICGPKTLPDYIKQRRRIHYGHHQVKKATGESPQHLLYIFPQNPLVAINLLLWLIRKKGATTFVTFLTLELFLSFIASVDVFSKKPNPAWSIVSSTKKLMEGSTTSDLTGKQCSMNKLHVVNLILEEET